jgi:hypothetical protein
MAEQRAAGLLAKGGEQHHRRPTTGVSKTPVPTLASQGVDKELAKRARTGLMHAAGLYAVDEMLPVDLDRMLARWKVGRALAKVERGKAGRSGKNSGHDVHNFKTFLAEVQLDIKAGGAGKNDQHSKR